MIQKIKFNEVKTSKKTLQRRRPVAVVLRADPIEPSTISAGRWRCQQEYAPERAAAPGRGRTFGALLAAALAVALVGSAGCGYHLSGRNRYLPPNIRRIAIPVFSNETRRADIEQRITESLLNEFIKRGDYATQPQKEGADALLEGAVTGYSATPVSLNSAQGTAQRLEVVVQARVRLSDLHTGRILWSQEHFIFRSQYDVDRNPSGSFDREIVAIDRIAQGFAETVVTSLLEGF